MHLLLPKMGLPPGVIDNRPLFYVAGPIRGAGDWQGDAYKLFAKESPNCIIATPCRYEAGAAIRSYVLPGAIPDAYERQTDWEDRCMRAAAYNWFFGGRCLMFWLPCESKTNPRPKEAGPYAQDTYGELGYWRAKIEESDKDDPYRIVIGAEEGFPGLHKLQRDFDRAVSGTFTIHATLEATVHAAVKMAHAR